MIARAGRVDSNTAERWNALLDAFDASGAAAAAPCASELTITGWWRWCRRFDPSSNRVLGFDLVAVTELAWAGE